jgi:hypothetical protein
MWSMGCCRSVAACLAKRFRTPKALAQGNRGSEKESREQGRHAPVFKVRAVPLRHRGRCQCRQRHERRERKLCCTAPAHAHLGSAPLVGAEASRVLGSIYQDCSSRCIGITCLLGSTPRRSMCAHALTFEMISAGRLCEWILLRSLSERA